MTNCPNCGAIIFDFVYIEEALIVAIACLEEKCHE